MGFFTFVGVAVVALGLIAAGVIGLKIWKGDKNTEKAQQALEAFYTPPNALPDKPGVIIRSEPLDNVTVEGGQGYRVLYTTTTANGSIAAVSGMVFIPTAAQSGDRKVLAWAHGTVGLAPQCAPSRTDNPVSAMTDFLPLAMQQGWVVTATDYLGLGTPGPKTFLIGTQEAADVVNSVRAARQMPGAQAGTDWAVWGHSQGGNSSLWTGDLASKIAPELHLKAVGAAAPAAKLLTLVEQVWSTVTGWVIGGEAAVSFTDYYGGTAFTDSLTSSGQRSLASSDDECIIQSAIESKARDALGQQFFTSNPIENPAWVRAAQEQTPTPPADVPVFVAVGTADSVVAPGSNAQLQEQWCKAGTDLTMLWLGGLDHVPTAGAAGPSYIEWAANRFAGKPATRNCQFPPAVTPLPDVTPSASVKEQAKALPTPSALDTQ